MTSDDGRLEPAPAQVQSKDLAANVRPAPRRPAQHFAQRRMSNARSTRQMTRFNQSKRRHLQAARVCICGPFTVADCDNYTLCYAVLLLSGEYFCDEYFLFSV